MKDQNSPYFRELTMNRDITINQSIIFDEIQYFENKEIFRAESKKDLQNISLESDFFLQLKIRKLNENKKIKFTFFLEDQELKNDDLIDGSQRVEIFKLQKLKLGESLKEKFFMRWYEINSFTTGILRFPEIEENIKQKIELPKIKIESHIKKLEDNLVVNRNNDQEASLE